MDKELRVIAGAIITESKLSKEAKLQLLEFVQHEATDVQVKALLLDGKVLSSINKETEEIISARFTNSFAKKDFSKKIEEIMSRKKV